MTKRQLSPDENSDINSQRMDRKRRAAKTTVIEPVDDSDASFAPVAGGETLNSRRLPNGHSKGNPSKSHRQNGLPPTQQEQIRDLIPAACRNPVVVLEKDTPENLMAKRKSLGFNGSPLVRTNRRNDDDEAEKRRRHNLKATFNRQSIATPLTPVRSVVTNNRKSIAPSPVVFDPNQLKAHYTNCIKMAHGNKINVKNAFGFHIIDYMSALLKSNEINFTLATNTLDAGTKIYVNRVDAVHQEAQKVANGLVMALDNKNAPKENEKNQEMDDDNDDGAGDEPSAPKAKKKKVKKPGKTLTNAEALNATKMESNADIDPVLFRLTTAHDMGNVNGLFLANLPRNVRGELILDSNAVVGQVPQSSDDGLCDVPIESFIKSLEQIKSSDMQICPKMSGFIFTNRDEGLGLDVLRSESDDTTHLNRKSEFTFDLEAEIPLDEPEGNGAPLDPFDDLDMGGGFDDDLDDMMSEGTCDERQQITRKSVIRALNLESMPDLNKILSEMPDDYSYFNKKIIAAWAGPQYWKANNLWQRIHRSKDKLLPGGDGVARRERKKYEPVDFRQSLEERHYHPVASKTLKLKIKTLEKWCQSELVLPVNLRFDLSTLSYSFLKKDQIYKCQMARRDAKKHNQLDYDNMSEDDMGRCGTGFDAPNSPMAADDLDCPDDDYGFPTQTATQTQTNNLFEAFMGDNLVDQPFMVQQINLPYARFAKKIDVKALKKVISDIIDDHEPTGALNGRGGDVPGVDEKLAFSTMYAEISKHKRVTPQILQNISAPIAFVTLLHLANDQNLVLENHKDLKDIFIRREETSS